MEGVTSPPADAGRPALEFVHTLFARSESLDSGSLAELLASLARAFAADASGLADLLDGKTLAQTSAPAFPWLIHP